MAFGFETFSAYRTVRLEAEQVHWPVVFHLLVLGDLCYMVILAKVWGGDVRAMGAAPSYFGSVLEDSSPEGPRSLSCCFGSCSVSRKRRWARIPLEIILHRVKGTSIFSYRPLSLAGPSELKIIKFVQCLASKRCSTILETSKVISSQEGQRWRPPDLALPCSLIRKT